MCYLVRKPLNSVDVEKLWIFRMGIDEIWESAKMILSSNRAKRNHWSETSFKVRKTMIQLISGALGFAMGLERRHVFHTKFKPGIAAMAEKGYLHPGPP